MSASNEGIITFLLGDVIEIDAPDNELLNNANRVYNLIKSNDLETR